MAGWPGTMSTPARVVNIALLVKDAEPREGRPPVGRAAAIHRNDNQVGVSVGAKAEARRAGRKEPVPDEGRRYWLDEPQEPVPAAMTVLVSVGEDDLPQLQRRAVGQSSHSSDIAAGRSAH